MPQFFIKDAGPDGIFQITGSDFRHLLKVRRIQIDDKIKIRYEDALFEALVLEISENYIEAKIGDKIQSANRGPEVILYSAVLKSGNFDFVIQKAVETGAARIVPVITERTVADISGKKKSKLERWKKISLEASKQSLRDFTPEICEPLEFRDALKSADNGIKIIAHPGADINVRSVLTGIGMNMPVSVFIGPEGGFSQDEIALAADNGFTPVNFGFSHLRAETAVITFLSIIIYELGEV